MDRSAPGRSPGIRIPEFRDGNGPAAPAGSPACLAAFIERHAPVLALTGAGCSTASGIPAYRDATGKWNRRQPILYPDFVASATVRRRYWARSFLGWPVMQAARPGPAHHALVELDRRGLLAGLVTQNVDGLHQAAGQPGVLELHGGLQRVLCLDCGAPIDRSVLQDHLLTANPDWAPDVLSINPDGDAELDEAAYPGFRVVACGGCGGRLKPDVVFFGESVPRDRFETIGARLDRAGALLVVGSSLVVGSGYRIVREAQRRGLPIAAATRGRTRADAVLMFNVHADCGETLVEVLAAL
ncbi:NAD-dependent protein deacetylase [Wenzhouxiangella sp. XN79A]|uniref:NAD-dependent protein deacetylase n=1 Tax=Wenzhouxiangella sp. XN79A TaxID=2724193 RepID=UPI00144AF1CD|nr:NAD-dependent protein deacetylase [Wenzhouxiangella sp. XN79A]NKI34316.1 NAD-dependent protein deacetylase [Wenzhouxiangella sp. XN79A]